MAPNKKKKKPAANPARGFATVSVPSTKPKHEITDPQVDGSSGNDTHTQQSQDTSIAGSDVKATEQAGHGVSSTSMTPEQLEQHLDISEIRLAVENRGSKIRKDIARQVKTLETDRRLLRLQSTPLSIGEETIGRAMELIKLDPSYPALPLSRPVASSGLTLEMDLSLKLWALYETLEALHFPDIDAVVKHLIDHTCLTSGTTAQGRDYIWGLEEALYWYSINSKDQDLPPFGRTQTATTLAGEEEEMLDGEVAESVKLPSRDNAPSSSKSSSPTLTPAEASGISTSEDDDDGDPPSIQHYLDLQSRLFALRNPNVSEISAEERSKSLGREERRIVAKLERIIRDPLFDRKAADYEWMTLRRTLEIEAGQAQARNLKGRDGPAPDPFPVEENHAEGQEGAGDSDILSNLFELGDQLPDTTGEAGPEVTMQDFGKWSGASPRRILEDACKTRDSGCRITFKKVSNSLHAHRYQAEVSWSKDIVQDFPADMLSPEVIYRQGRRLTSVTMQTIATPSSMQSEAYTSTILLFILFAGVSQGERPNVRLPTVWRHFWNDLIERKNVYDSEQDVQRLSHLRRTVREHLAVVEAREIRAEQSRASEGVTSEAARLSAPVTAASQFSRVKDTWQQKASSPSYQQMLGIREQLPVYKQKADLLEVFNNNQLMILCGETGSGKSTQTPALILEHELSAGKDCRILCTQPRRISAMSLAARVGEELGENKGDLGTTRSLVGYAIRLESKVSSSTRLTYATTGVAMRLLERQDDLSNVNVLLIDEVHERNIDSDFLLIVLRRLLPRRPDLKVVLMSATIDAERFSSYLNGCPILTVPGRLFPVRNMFLEDAIELTNLLSFQKQTGMPDYDDTYNDDDADVSDIHSQLQSLHGYSEKTMATLRRLNEYRIDFGFIAKVVVAITTQPDLIPYSKAILIFMPGIAEMRRLHQVITSYPPFQHGWLFHILHSTVSTEDQQAAFRLPPQGMRKIVIATNIAETGITIPDITAVIDTGKEKIMRFDERRQVSRLTESFISKASSRQRQGRAARVQEGLCIKLYTRDRFERLMADHSTPEILRLSLSETILRVKLCALGPIEASLSEALDPPTPKNVRRAIEALKEEKVLTPTEDLTPIGRQLARLPLDIPLGKLVLNGLSFQCLDVMATVAALLSSKSPFITSVKATAAIEQVRKSFARGDSDLLLLFNAYEAWKRAEMEGKGATFCQKAFLSRQTLSLIEDQKIQLLVHLVDAGLLVLSREEKIALQMSRSRSGRRNFFNVPMRYNFNNDKDVVIDAAISLSFYPRLVRREGKGWRNVSTNQNVMISPQSINRGAAPTVQWLSFYETVQTKSRGLTVSETSVIDELSIALLIGEADCKLFSGTMTIDSNRIRFCVRNWKTILVLKILRSKIRQDILDKAKTRGAGIPDNQSQWVELFYSLYK